MRQHPHLFWCIEANFLQDALQDGVQPPRTNVVHAPIDLLSRVKLSGWQVMKAAISMD